MKPHLNMLICLIAILYFKIEKLERFTKKVVSKIYDSKNMGVGTDVVLVLKGVDISTFYTAISRYSLPSSKSFFLSVIFSMTSSYELPYT